jgi:hypothetical protein
MSVWPDTSLPQVWSPLSVSNLQYRCRRILTPAFVSFCESKETCHSADCPTARQQRKLGISPSTISHRLDDGSRCQMVEIAGGG